MRRIAVIATLAAAGLLAGALPAEADGRGRGRGHGHWHHGHGHGHWVHPQYGPSYRAPHYYYAPRPVYVMPPPVYYAPPPPVYYAPPPPAVIYPGWGYPGGEVSFGLRLPIR